MDKIIVAPGEKFPTHHISLSDGEKTIGLIIADSKGNANPYGIVRNPVPRTAMKTTTGNQKYSDFEPPWSPIAQEDWSGGRGSEDFDQDITRYYDGWRANTLFSNKIFLGGQETYAYGHRSQDKSLPGSLTWLRLVPGARKYMAVKFTASASYSAVNIYLWIKRIGTPTDTLTVALCSDDGGNPGTVLQSATATTTNITDTISQFYKFTISAESLTATTAYWVKVYAGANSNDENCFAIGVNAASGTSKQSADDSTWATSGVDLYYRLTDADGTSKLRFFTHRRQLYMIKNNVTSAPALYVNGDRGFGDSNAAAKTTLIDATKSWVVDEWIGCIAVIIAGPGANDPKPWRTITDNDGTTLTVDTAWTTTHTTASEYVILGSNKWTVVANATGLTADVTDICTVNNITYFAQGDAVNIRKMQYPKTGGGNDYNFADDGTNKATFLTTVRDATDGLGIWKANNDTIGVARAPIVAFGTNLTFATAITFTDDWGKITGIWEYGPSTKQLWVFREGSIFAMVRGSSTYSADEIPLKEIHSAQEYTNGSVFLTHNVYIYFNFGYGLERYYNSVIDDVGPNNDSGLPTNRQGIVSCAAGYPGRIFIGIDGDTSGYSSILGNSTGGSDGSGWCEIYRAPAIGERLTHMLFQPIPGTKLDRLWIAIGSDVLWIPFPSGTVDPLADANMRFVHESVITSGYQYAGLYDVYKFYHSLKLFTENLSETNGQWVEVDYQADEDTTWTPMPEAFYESPMQEIKLLEILGVNGKRIRFRLKLQTSDNTKTPIIKGTVTENISRVSVKYSYGFAYRVKDGDVNLRGEPEGMTAEEKQDLIDEWATNITPLVMRCGRKRYDNKTVFINPTQGQPYKIHTEGYLEKLSVIEV